MKFMFINLIFETNYHFYILLGYRQWVFSEASRNVTYFQRLAPLLNVMLFCSSFPKQTQHYKRALQQPAPNIHLLEFRAYPTHTKKMASV